MPRMTELFGAKEQKVERKWVTTWIHYTKLKRNPGQYRERSREMVEDLADLIESDGEVLQNLIVRKCDADSYEIVAGHKRALACQLLVEERGKKQFEFLPCVIRNVSDARARFSLVSTNIVDKKTSYEVMHELEEMIYLMQNYPEEFPEMQEKGRLVEKLAKKLNIAKSVVIDYQMISNNLGEQGRKAFQKGKLNKTAAVAMAGLPEKEQEDLLKQGITKAKEITVYKQKETKRNKGQKEPERNNVPKFGTKIEIAQSVGKEKNKPDNVVKNITPLFDENENKGKPEHQSKVGRCPYCKGLVSSVFNQNHCGNCGKEISWVEKGMKNGK